MKEHNFETDKEDIEIVDDNVNMESNEERPGVGYEIGIGNTIGIGTGF